MMMISKCDSYAARKKKQFFVILFPIASYMCGSMELSRVIWENAWTFFGIILIFFSDLILAHISI